MEKQNKSIGKTVLVVLLLIVTIVSLILATYAWAKYTTNTNGTASAQVAKWNVTGSFNNTKFTQTYTHVLADRIAPGTSGELSAKFDVGIDTEVDVDYKIYIDTVSVKKASDGITDGTIPTNMKFKNAAGQVTTLTPGTIIDSGRVNNKTGLTFDKAVLTWEWPYTTGNVVDNTSNIYEGDSADTRDGEDPVIITVTYRLDAWQVNPAE